MKTLIILEKDDVKSKILVLNWFKKRFVDTKALSSKQIPTGNVRKIGTLKKKIKEQCNINVEVIRLNSKRSVKITTSEEVVKELGLKLRV